MKTFIKHDIPKLKRIDLPTGRIYETPTGSKYPSVTSVVSLHNKEGIDNWRKRVGEEEANRVSKKASSRGTAIHKLCEDYIKGDTPEISMFDAEMFNSIRPHLDKIDNIHGIETQMFSHHLEVAGTADCIAEYEGKLCIIDYKTSTKPKKREWIHNYFMQMSAYAVMFEEHTNIPVTRLLIIMGVDDDKPQVFMEKRDDWIKQFRNLRAEYKRIKGN